MRTMLILFDIDGTLLLTDGAGAKAMQEAGRRVVGTHYSLASVSFAGRLDPHIWAEGAALAGVEDPDALHDTFRKSYRASLARRLSMSSRVYLLPGVRQLLDSLRMWEGVTLGLVTGNYPETGTIKLEAAGLSMIYFPVRAWGCDGEDRRALPRIAMERYEAMAGEAIDPAHVVVIGDTLADIDCAHANGCQALAVASGPAYSLEELQAANPELALDDLVDTPRVIEFLQSVRNSDPA